MPPSVDLVKSYEGIPVMVTGGLGFIGSNLARRLVALGADVLVVDSLNPDYGGNRANLAGVEDRMRVVIADLRDASAVRGLVAGRHVIFNLAAQVGHLDSMTQPMVDLEINAVAQLRLLELCRELNPEVTIVHASTRQFYGRPDYLPVDERHPLRPPDVNGINKMAGEAYYTLYHRVYGMRTVSLRLTNTYGPRMRIRDGRQTFLGLWLRRVLEGEPFEVWGGDQLRDLAYVDDVVEAFLRAAATPGAIGEVFNIGGAPPVTLTRLAELLVEVAGQGRFERKAFPEGRKRIDIGDYHADDRRFRAATGWAPEIDLREGLARSLTYYRSHFGAYVP
jgi:UDP-glucose 4-epimerase